MEKRVPMTIANLRCSASLSFAIAGKPVGRLLGRRYLVASCIAAAAVLTGCALPAGMPGSAPSQAYGLESRSAAVEVDRRAGLPGTAPSSGKGAADGAEPVSDKEIVQSTPQADDRPLTPPIPIDPLQPDVKINLDDATARADLWTRLRRGFAIPDLDSDLVREREQWYASRPDYVARMTERSSRYLFHIIEEVERRGMPSELALLPYIESAFNPQALSTAQASGMWQFIPSTGKDFELKQNMFRDDRRDVLASTRAALDYLGRLHAMFGDWHLALAAYNWGEGSVQRAIARNQKLGLPTNYEALSMPNETRNYVPKLQAVKNIIARPDLFRISLPNLDNHPYFLSVPIERDIDVSLVMRFAGMQADEFKTLNPQLNKPVILASGTPQVLLPYDNASLFVRNMAEHRGGLATWTAWVAPRTLRPSEVAALVGMDEPTLREINHIPAKMLVKGGSTLLVRRSGNSHGDVSVHVADNAVMTLAPDVPPPVKVTFKAGKNDSVASIAQRWGVTTAQAADWNGMRPNAVFKAGQTVIVYSSRPLSARTRMVSNSENNKAATARDARRAAAIEAQAEAVADREASDKRQALRQAQASKRGVASASKAEKRAAQKAGSAARKMAADRSGSNDKVAKAAKSRSSISDEPDSVTVVRTRIAQGGGAAAKP
jgi:membrane-bound lytic murein transglycosylase D